MIYIVMPVINNLQLTKDAFKSIVEGEVNDFGFILIDQASTDDTAEWGNAMQEFRLDGRYIRFIYVNFNPRIALAKAWNEGAKMAFDKGATHVAILNNDIYLHKKTLLNLMQFMDKTGYLLVTGDNVKDRMSLDTMLRQELPMPYTDYDLQKIEGWRAEGPDFSCFMINEDTFNTIGLFDENYLGAYCEDQDYHVRINRAFKHISLHNDQGIDPNRVHAKRLSTAPYYHYASQTISTNHDLRPEIMTMHNRNQSYYLNKWGASHPDAMDGMGNVQPFGDATKNWRDW